MLRKLIPVLGSVALALSFVLQQPTLAATNPPSHKAQHPTQPAPSFVKYVPPPTTMPHSPSAQLFRIPTSGKVSPNGGVFDNVSTYWSIAGPYLTQQYNQIQTQQVANYTCVTIACSWQFFTAFAPNQIYDCPEVQNQPAWVNLNCGYTSNGSAAWSASGYMGIGGQNITVTYCEVPQGGNEYWSDLAQAAIGIYTDAQYDNHDTDGGSHSPTC